MLMGGRPVMPLLDRSATISDLKEVAASFTAKRDWDQFHDAKDLAIGLVTEASELLQHFRFKSADEIEQLLSHRQVRLALEDEMADVFFMLLRLSTRLQTDLAATFERKLKKNSRNYPARRSKGKNIKHDER